MNIGTKVTTHNKIELPPLPEPGEAMSKWAYDESDMQAYARDAIEADRKRQGDWQQRAEAREQEIYRLGAKVANLEGERDAARYELEHQRRGEPVAYLDLGVGGYMDVGTDLTDEQLAALPKGRHMLGIIGTYGVDGYAPAEPVTHQGYQPIQSGSLPPPPAPKTQQPADPVETLINNQEPLGEEFQRVLDENRWDLYEKGTEPVKVPVIEPSDLRIDTYRTEPYSAWVVRPDIGVRVTHVPTGLSAACHEDRSVHRNRVLAMEKLQKMLQTHKPVEVVGKPSIPSDDVLADALNNLEHDNYEQSYSGYKNRQADIELIRAALSHYRK